MSSARPGRSFDGSGSSIPTERNGGVEDINGDEDIGAALRPYRGGGAMIAILLRALPGETFSSSSGRMTPGGAELDDAGARGLVRKSIRAPHRCRSVNRSRR